MASENIIDFWHSKVTKHKSVYVVPDGCQDVIFSLQKNSPPQVYLSPLYLQTINVEMEPETEMMGFRLRPGCEVKQLDKSGLLSSLHSTSKLTDQIENATHTNENISEVLHCIKQHGTSIQHCANQLGVSPRTLQRVISRNTPRSPSFWLRLARARQSAKTLVDGGIFTEVAYQYQYTDQSHMCREIKHWFGVTPSELLKRHDLISQLFWQAY